MFCVRCGTALPGGAAFCPSCGTAVASGATAPLEPPSAPSSPSPVAGEGAPPGPPQGPPPAETRWESTLPAYATVPTPVPAAQPARFGGFWRRFWGLFLDGLILNIVMLPIGVAMGVSWTALLANEGDIAAEGFASYLASLLALSFFGMLLNWLYSAFLQSSSKQGTLGQMALGLKVTDIGGGRISFARATGRHFATIITGFTLTIGYLVMLFTEKRQTLHDLIAGTVVVRVLP